WCSAQQSGQSTRSPEHQGPGAAGAVRHPLSTTCSGGAAEGSVAVGDVHGLVVGDALGQAVPEELQPAVAEGAQGGVVAFAGFDFLVVELSGPAASGQATEGPLVDGGAEVAVMREAAGDDEVALARAAGDRGLAGVALQPVRGVELFDVFADLSGDPSGEDVSQAGEAQVDRPAWEGVPRVGVLDGVVAAGAPPAEQQLGHPLAPAAAGLVQREQLDGGQPDAGGLGAHQVVAGGQRGRGEGVGDAVGEAVGPAVLAGAGEAGQLLTGGAGQFGLGGPALEQPQHGGGAQI